MGKSVSLQSWGCRKFSSVLRFRYRKSVSAGTAETVFVLGVLQQLLFFVCFEDSGKKAMRKNKIGMMLSPSSSPISLHWLEKVLERQSPSHFSFLTSYFMKPCYQ